MGRNLKGKYLVVDEETGKVVAIKDTEEKAYQLAQHMRLPIITEVKDFIVSGSPQRRDSTGSITERLL